MIKKSFRLMLLVAFALSSVMFVACNKYDDDIERIDGELAALNATVQTLKAAVDGGAVISSVSNTAEGVKFTLSNGQSYVVNHGTVGKDGANGADGKDGQDGKPGSVVTIGENGNWHIDGVDQGVSAVGASTFVVDCGSYYELNVLEKVDGENAEIVKINLPKTKAITELKVVDFNEATGALVYGGKHINLNYGPELSEDIEFNGKTYDEESFLVAAGSKFTAIVNPIDADATLYNFSLVDSKGNAPFVITGVSQHKTDSKKPLTKADTPNKGVYNMAITFADGFNFNKIPASNIAYALTTTTANGVVASNYEVTVASNKKENGTITHKTSYSDVAQETPGSINLKNAFSAGSDLVVDYYFELVNPTVDAAKGVVLDGYTLTAPADTEVSLKLHYLPVYASDEDDIVTVSDITASFAYVPGSASLTDVTWTIQNDGKASTTEHIVYVPLGDLQASLKGADDKALPTMKGLADWTWADGTGLNKITVTRNGKKYGKDDDSDAWESAIPANVFPAITGFYYINDDDEYEIVDATTTIDMPLYVAFTFNSATAFPGEFMVTLAVNKASNNEDAANPSTTKYDYEIPVKVTIVAPATPEIVKNTAYFDGDNAVVYGDARGSNVKANLADLFATTGLSFAVTSVNYDIDANGKIEGNSEKYYKPWLTASAGSLEIPKYDGAKKAWYNAVRVGATHEFTATKLVLANPYIDQMSYKFNVTVKSPVVVSYVGAAKTINEDPIWIAVDEFSGKSLKTGDALYIGTIQDLVTNKTYTVDTDNHIASVTVAEKDDDYDQYIEFTIAGTNSFNGTVTYKDADGDEVSKASAVQIQRVAGIAQQSPVTCTVNVTVKDLWGVSHVIPVAVTVNPLQ